jgi:thioredoxin reductase
MLVTMTTDENLQKSHDVVVVGGGAAGLSAALMLARPRRSVVVLDGGRPRNAPAAGVHGLLGHDGVPPGVLLERGRGEVEGYGGHVVRAEVVGVDRTDDGFSVLLDNGRRVGCRRLVVATGLVDELPDVPGLAERWGRDVLHCPYCHGWEVRDRAIGVLGSGPASVHQALLFSQLSADVVLFRHQLPALSDEDVVKLAARGVAVVDGEVEAVEVADDRITGLRLVGGRVVPREAVVVAPRFVARAAFLEGLGLSAVPHPSGGEYVPSGPAGQTDVPGVWVAGNVTELTAQVGASAAAGALAGAHVNADLVEEEIRRATAAPARPAADPEIAAAG